MWLTLGRVLVVASWLATRYPELISTHINHVLGLPAFYLDSWPLKMELIGCPETSVSNYHYLLPINSEQRSSQCEIGIRKTQFANITSSSHTMSKKFFFPNNCYTASTFVVTESRKWKTDSCNSLTIMGVQENLIFRNKEVTSNMERSFQ